MEDAATAEICRAQIWQWVRHGAHTSDGRPVSLERFMSTLQEELQVIAGEIGADRYRAGHFDTAAEMFVTMISQPVFDEFLTLPAYQRLS
jgi:malate synthase